MLALPTSMRIHNVIHVSLLKKYVSDPNHVIYWNVIQLEHKGDFQVVIVFILDQKVKELKKKSMGLVKVQWICYGPEDATWEHEEAMREVYPQFFTNFEKN
jgi:hypothetical protein